MPDEPRGIPRDESSERVFYEAQDVAHHLIESGIPWREIEDIAHMLVSIAHTEGRAALEERRK